MTARLVRHAVVLLGMALCAPAMAVAQASPGPVRVGGLVSGSLAGGHASPTLGVSAGVRLAPRLSVEGDLSHFRNITLVEFQDSLLNLNSWHARVTSLAANVLVDLPSGVQWLRPYAAGGGGAARVRREFRGASTCPCARTDMRPLATIGGGVDFLLSPQVAVGIDLRFQRVFEDDRVFRPNLRSLKRVGSVVSYRF